MDRSNIDSLMMRLADGDRSAFDPLFAAVWPIVRDFANNALGGATDAEDAAQEALLSVIAGLALTTGPAAVAAHVRG